MDIRLLIFFLLQVNILYFIKYQPILSPCGHIAFGVTLICFHRIPYFRSWIKEREGKRLWYFTANKKSTAMVSNLNSDATYDAMSLASCSALAFTSSIVPA